MKRLLAIGEALIDFIPNQKDSKLKDVEGFTRQVGGAPCNVACTTTKLGGQAEMITQLGNDAFGDLIVETISNIGVHTNYIRRTDEANTALAFVSLTKEGERDFSFYRKPSADMLYQPSNIDAITVTENDMLHFCSVDLVDSPMKQAHKALINKVKSASGTIIFDPNVRLPLWTSEEECKNAIREFLPLAHVLKISDEELTFVTGNKVEKEAIAWLFQGSVEAVIYTKGKEGAEIHFKDGTVIDHSGYKVKAIDTTGAGDAFIGALINRLAVSDIDNPIAALKVQGENILEFSNIVAAKVTTKYGAIESIPNLNEVNEVLEH
ncbi:carbohydrate kinase family protein [Staphylococcus cohnii]|uniref:Fructokinase n=1 Tax=Staphylococcus cohnii subsp. cohnii TaxID=74704 RepID=A0A0M2P2H4_STACC|nr:carbohydrate kinase [Staphylococcus cohnii]TGP60957.1 carbohydrate kinase [bacterium M00.F.Ca.ET.229.01.1.1]TGS37904.1 carbohydrate kinase [bacterium M00.F.Ca.ET.180.01.1.1]AYX90293.1 carbohydrate kinase [Staphylococcus cohnii]KKI64078.1 Fructokinase [Staphylococcus cohnii subsp. cohnii]MDE1710248.1 carbohydrate kinase [Staphylococcus cohnii]